MISGIFGGFCLVLLGADIAQGNWVFAAIDAGLAALNILCAIQQEAS